MALIVVWIQCSSSLIYIFPVWSVWEMMMDIVCITAWTLDNHIPDSRDKLVLLWLSLRVHCMYSDGCKAECSLPEYTLRYTVMCALSLVPSKRKICCSYSSFLLLYVSSVCHLEPFGFERTPKECCRVPECSFFLFLLRVLFWARVTGDPADLDLSPRRLFIAEECVTLSG